MKSNNSLNNDEIIKNLKNTYGFAEYESIGSNRFIRKIKPIGQDLKIVTDLFDEDCNLIPIEKEYNEVCIITSGIAPVIRYDFIKFGNGKPSIIKKMGAIDINGNELLPCIYDKVHIHLGGFVEISLNNILKATNVNVLLDKKFDFDKAMDWH